MLGLIFIYFIWKYFADLAELHQKNKWAWGIGAVVIFYSVQIVIGLMLGVMYAIEGNEISTDEELIITFAGLLASLLIIVGLYYMLRSIWQSKRSKKIGDDILDLQ